MRFGAAFPVRVEFAKRGRVRFTSHRDVARAFERAFRIEALPLAFSEGFSPRPKVSFGLALPTGAESDAEYLDVSFAVPVDVDALAAGLTTALPEGMTVTGAAPLLDGAPALQDAITAVEWQLTLVDEHGEPVAPARLADACAALLARDTIVVARTRKGRVADGDVRGAIRELTVDDHGTIGLVASTQPSVKPVEVIAALAHVAPELGDLAERRVVRTHQWIERDGARLRPLDADTRPRDPEGCAHRTRKDLDARDGHHDDRRDHAGGRRTGVAAR